MTNATVLLVEDDAWLADLYSDVLRAAGFGTVHAPDAMQAMAALDEHVVDVLVLDLLLPQHNGIALLHELRSHPDLAELPVILQSAVEVAQSGLAPEDWRAYGVVECISKVSARPQDLVRAVRRTLGEDDETV